MNILYFIGNGFDIAQGMKTRFKDFFSGYVNTSSTEQSVMDLKRSMRDDYETWADMERAFGNYTAFINNTDEFDIVYYDILEALQTYLEGEQEKFQLSDVKKAKIRKDLITPDKYFEEQDRELLESFFKSKEKESWYIHVQTLNYTNTFERLLDFNNAAIHLEKRYINSSILLKNVIHLHGKLEDTILMGVNDESQIANSEFKSSLDVKEILIKPHCNANMKNTINSRCEAMIKYANVIVLYGTSLGITDKKWWSLIGEQFQRKDFILLYFYHGQLKVPSRKKHMLGRVTRKVMEDIKEKLNLTNLSDADLGNKLFIAINKPMFN